MGLSGWSQVTFSVSNSDAQPSPERGELCLPPGSAFTVSPVCVKIQGPEEVQAGPPPTGGASWWRCWRQQRCHWCSRGVV